MYQTFALDFGQPGIDLCQQVGLALGRVVHGQAPWGNFPVEEDLKACGPADASGEILREDTLALSNIKFAYADGSQAVLVEYNPHNVDSRTVIEVNLHPFATDGTPLVTIGETAKRWVRVYLPANLLAGLPAGSPAESGCRRSRTWPYCC